MSGPRLNWRGFLIIAIGVVLLLAVLTVASKADGRRVHWRKWTVSYNSALSLHEAAVPAHYAHPGDHLVLKYHHRRLHVHAIAGGCTCFDISDEGMNQLASTGQGTIRAKVRRR